MPTKYDAIIIGTGQAGPALAARLAAAGQRVAIIERDLVGGSCVNYGCLPTKALVASARAAHMARRGGDFGVVIEAPVQVDMKKVNARMRKISGASNRGVTNWLEGLETVELIRGHGRFESANTVSVTSEGGRRLLSADKIFINVGTRERIPEIAGLDQIEYLTNKTIMNQQTLPEHLVIIGGSYIGLEFAQMYRRFGSDVTVLERGTRVISRDDEDVSATVKEVLEREGVSFQFGVKDVKLARSEDQIRVHVTTDTSDKGESDVLASHLLLAVGRLPNSDSLDLSKAGIETDSRGYVPVDDQLRTNVPGVWALGDVNGKGAFTHTSYNDYEIVAANLLDDDARRVSDRIPVYGLYVDPPLGRIGMTEDQARASGRNVLIGKRAMSLVGRARERSETDGFIKILVDADSKEILGAAILGIGGDEVVQVLLTAMYEKTPYTVISRSVYIHPTVSELIPTTLQSLEPLT